MKRSRPTILDQHGRPVAFRLFEAGNTATRREHPGAFYNATQDTRDALPRGTWAQILSSGRFLFANVPIVRGALLEQAAYSFPLVPQYTGKDKAWGQEAERWLNDWHKICNVKGPPYTQHINSRIRMLAYKVDGDIGTVLTFGTSDFPLLQHIRAHRIGDRLANSQILQTGRYKGKRMVNGVIANAVGRPIAFNILGDTEAEDRTISASDMFLTFRPDYSDQFRGISHLVASISDFGSIKRLREYEMRAQQLGASIGLIEKNETGSVDEAAMAITQPTSSEDPTGTASGLITRTYEAGMTLYYKSQSGSGLEAFRNDRPSADASRFEDKIVTGALYGTEWDPNFALAIKEPGGAWARTILQKINRCIKANVWTEAQAQRREDGYAMAKAMKLGILGTPPDGNWFSWEYELGIPAITADSGNEENAKREAYKLGTCSLRDITTEKGRWWEDHRDQRELETRDLLQRAQNLRVDFPELTLSEALNLLEQRTPNGPSGSSIQSSVETIPEA
jgi:hypothetical protein